MTTSVYARDTAWDGRFRTHFAPVCGVQMYEQMAIRNRLPRYHLLLAHDILARPDRYANVFQYTGWGPMDKTIILDNSVVELKEPMGILDVAIAAETVQATVIVLPDVYRDAKATVESCKAAYHTWVEELDARLGDGNYSLMYVPQGKTLEEYVWCAQQMESNAEYPKIGWWGIARNMVEHIGSRQKPVVMCNLLNGRRQIHMLGFSDNLIDDVAVVRAGGHMIMGIDSAVPLRLNKKFTITSVTEPRPAGWLEEAPYTGLVEQNIEIAARLFGGFGRD